MQARDRIVAVLSRLVKERRASPADDGLSRILQARTAEGVTMADEEAVLELHHVVIAGYIVFAELAAIVLRLTEHPDVRERLGDEVRSAGTLTVESLAALPYLRQVVMEVKRLCPIIPAVFGKAKTSFEIDRVTVPAGWMVMWALLPSHTTHGLPSPRPARASGKGGFFIYGIR